jgi:subtilisin-like proprotein convertase family protein
MAVGAVGIRAAVTVPSTDVPKTIGDLRKVSSTLGFPMSGTVTDANLLINIRHTWDGDVGISLAPSHGVSLAVWNYSDGNCGADGDNFTNTVIDDEGQDPNCAASGAPYTGNRRGAPGGVVSPTVMTAFNGFRPAATWVLTIADDYAGDTGTLLGWSLTLDFPWPLPVELMKREGK